MDPQRTNIYREIGQFAVLNYKKPVEEVKKLNQEERRHLQIALNSLQTGKVTKSTAGAASVFERMKAKLSQEKRTPANKVKKAWKQTKNVVSNRIGCDELAISIKELQTPKNTLQLKAEQNGVRVINLAETRYASALDECAKSVDREAAKHLFMWILPACQNNEEEEQALEYLKNLPSDVCAYDHEGQCERFIGSEEEAVNRWVPLVFHGTNSVNASAILEHGLSTDHRVYDNELFNKIVDQCQNLSIFPCARGDRGKFYVTKRIDDAIGYAKDSPEWLKLMGTEEELDDKLKKSDTNVRTAVQKLYTDTKRLYADKFSVVFAFNLNPDSRVVKGFKEWKFLAPHHLINHPLKNTVPQKQLIMFLNL